MKTTYRYSGAHISQCGRYRYRLTRCWDDTLPHVTFVMLNPSTADADQDDPTIRRCVGFARSLRGGGLTVVNLYALRATNPDALWQVDDAQRVGAENDSHLALVGNAARFADRPIIAAWGVHARPERVAHVLSLPGMERLVCLGETKAGHPRHPLYVRADTVPYGWPRGPMTTNRLEKAAEDLLDELARADGLDLDSGDNEERHV